MTIPDLSLPSTRSGSAVTKQAPLRQAARRVTVLSVLVTVLLGTGLYLEFLASRNWNAGEVVLAVHLILGLVFATVFSSWIVRHVRQGLARSRRTLFTGLSWLLLAKFTLLILTGLMMTLPAGIYLTGGIWFWRFETTELIVFVHLWSAFAAVAGLIAHLALRHWRRPSAPAGKSGA